MMNLFMDSRIARPNARIQLFIANLNLSANRQIAGHRLLDCDSALLRMSVIQEYSRTEGKWQPGWGWYHGSSPRAGSQDWAESARERRHLS